MPALASPRLPPVLEFAAWRLLTSDHPCETDEFTLTDTPEDSSDKTDVGESRLMTELSITHRGRYYHFDSYRYERLADAINFAQLVRARGLQRTDPPAVVEVDSDAGPDAADRRLMFELSIVFEDGSFVFEGFRYDRLIDAANYARHRRQLGSTAL